MFRSNLAITSTFVQLLSEGAQFVLTSLSASGGLKDALKVRLRRMVHDATGATLTL